MSAVDGAFNGSVEAVSFNLPAALLPGGRVLVYLQAIDAAGNRGPVAAVFVSSEGGAFADGFEPAPP